jgi:hypothetical protein
MVERRQQRQGDVSGPRCGQQALDVTASASTHLSAPTRSVTEQLSIASLRLRRNVQSKPARLGLLALPLSIPLLLSPPARDETNKPDWSGPVGSLQPTAYRKSVQPPAVLACCRCYCQGPPRNTGRQRGRMVPCQCHCHFPKHLLDRLQIYPAGFTHVQAHPNKVQSAGASCDDGGDNTTV